MGRLVEETKAGIKVVLGGGNKGGKIGRKGAVVCKQVAGRHPRLCPA